MSHSQIKPLRLKLRQFASSTHCAHVGRQLLAGSRTVAEHCHDFSEVFLVEKGRGIHRRNGVEETLTAGMIRFIVPDDVHGFYVQGDDQLTILNVAFSSRIMQELARRYGDELAHWPWHNGVASALHATADVAHELSLKAQAIAAEPSSRLRLDGYLLELFMQLKTSRPANVQSDTAVWPHWLQKAQQVFVTPAHFETGVQGLSEIAGVSPEHLNRTIQKVAGMTATELINQQRLAWAAGALRFGNASVTEIALQVGLENISYFIRIFKAQYGLTPAVYRKQARGLLPDLTH